MASKLVPDSGVGSSEIAEKEGGAANLRRWTLSQCRRSSTPGYPRSLLPRSHSLSSSRYRRSPRGGSRRQRPDRWRHGDARRRFFNAVVVLGVEGKSVDMVFDLL